MAYISFSFLKNSEGQRFVKYLFNLKNSCFVGLQKYRELIIKTQILQKYV